MCTGASNNKTGQKHDFAESISWETFSFGTATKFLQFRNCFTLESHLFRPVMADAGSHTYGQEKPLIFSKCIRKDMKKAQNTRWEFFPRLSEMHYVGSHSACSKY